MKKLIIISILFTFSINLFSQTYDEKQSTGIVLNSNPASSTNYIFLKSPVLGSSLTFTLPPTTGVSGQYLSVLADGSMTWTTIGASSAAGSTGEIQYNNAGSFGASSNLFWDNTNVRLGIGTSSPTYTLDVNGPIRTGSSGTDGQLRIYSEQGVTDYEIVFNPSTSMTQSTTYTLPEGDGANGEVLVTDGNGVLSWTLNQAGAFGCAGQGTGGGTGNVADGHHAFVGGGTSNTASGDDNFIGGGNGNIVTGDAGAIAAGSSNTVTADEGMIGAGTGNLVQGQEGAILAGTGNTVGPNGQDAVIGAGSNNYVDGQNSGILAGSSNTITINGYNGFIGAGTYNYLDDANAAIVAGNGNYIIGTAADYSFIGAGSGNYILSTQAAITAGTSNTITASRGFIGAGNLNYVTGVSGAIIAGTSNTITGSSSVIGSGTGNKITAASSFIATGTNNLIEDASAAILAGTDNIISTVADYSVIGAGTDNYIKNAQRGAIIAGSSNTLNLDGDHSVIVGGENNLITESYSVIGAGISNTITDNYSAILAGENNIVSGLYSTILGGKDNIVSGDYSLAFGRNSSATANYSVAIGRKAQADDQGSMVFADGNDDYIESQGNNTLTARFTGGFFFYTKSDQTTGAKLIAGSSAWATVSDSNQKELFVYPKLELFADRIMDLPISSWSYNGFAKKGIRNYGPMAQDFYRLFGDDGVGKIGSDTTIITHNLTSVGIVALQGIAKKYERSQNELEILKKENAKHKISIENMNNKYAKLEKIIDGLLEERKRIKSTSKKDMTLKR